VDAAEAYTATFTKDYREIMCALGNPGGLPTTSQRKYIDKWLTDFGMSVELILAACDKSAVNIGKPKLTYIDKIITRWNNGGIHTLEAVNADTEEFVNAAANRKAEEFRPAAKTQQQPQQRRNRFANFKPRERDYDQLKKLEREYLLKSLEM